jgi:hypothetical protein
MRRSKDRGVAKGVAAKREEEHGCNVDPDCFALRWSNLLRLHD